MPPGQQHCVAIIAAARQLAPDSFAWRQPPYEYENDLMPIDILWGHSGLRTGIDDSFGVETLLEAAQRERETLRESTAPFLLYD